MQWLKPFKVQAKRRTDQGDFWWELRAYAYYDQFNHTKIIYPYFNAERNFSFESNGAFSNDKSYLISSDNQVLLALLNSRALWFALSSMIPPVRGGYHELRVQYVEQIPIPALDNSARADLAAASNQASATARERLGLQSALTRRIPDLCPPGRDPKLTTRLQEWWTLPDFAAFRAEVKKVFKADIPLAERSAWEEWITRDRAGITRLTAEIVKAEAEIDRIVYELFELTPDEIALLEASI